MIPIMPITANTNLLSTNLDYIIFWLLNDNSSPFNGRLWNNFSLSSVFYDVIAEIAFLLGHLFKTILDGMYDFAIGAYKFLSFSESSFFTGIDPATGKIDPKHPGLYNVISKYIWIPVLICGLIVCYKILFGGRNVGKQFFKNIGFLFLAVVILPSVFSFMNTEIIDENYFKSTTNQESTADNILRSNAIDKVWLFDEMIKDSEFQELREKLNSGIDSKFIDSVSEGEYDFSLIWDDIANIFKESSENGKALQKYFDKLKGYEFRKKYLKSAAAQHLTFSDGGVAANEKITEYVDNDDYSPYSDSDSKLVYEKINGVANFFRIRAGILNNGEPFYFNLSDGSNGPFGVLGDTYLGKQSYWRYDIDWINVFIELLAHAYVAFVVGYCAVKLIIELIAHRIFGGMMAAMDLSGGDRIKKYFTAIIGCYMGLLIGAMVLPIYSAGCEFIATEIATNSGFVRAVLEIVLALVIVNVPNIITQYFGINTGARAGMIAFIAGAHAARGTARMAKNASEKLHHIGHSRHREHLQDARFDSRQHEEQEREAKHDRQFEELRSRKNDVSTQEQTNNHSANRHTSSSNRDVSNNNNLRQQNASEDNSSHSNTERPVDSEGSGTHFETAKTNNSDFEHNSDNGAVTIPHEHSDNKVVDKGKDAGDSIERTTTDFPSDGKQADSSERRIDNPDNQSTQRQSAERDSGMLNNDHNIPMQSTAESDTKVPPQTHTQPATSINPGVSGSHSKVNPTTDIKPPEKPKRNNSRNLEIPKE